MNLSRFNYNAKVIYIRARYENRLSNFKVESDAVMKDS